MMTTAKIAARIASAIAPEIEAMLREQADAITDLEERLSAANDRATAAESCLEQLRRLLSPAAPAPVIVPITTEPMKASPTRDDLIAAFHAKREIGPCSIKELGSTIGVNEPSAHRLYNEWCAQTGKTRINYYSNGQRVDALAPAPVKAPPTRDDMIAAFHAKREIGPCSIKELCASLGVNHKTAQLNYNNWCAKTGNVRVNYYTDGRRVPDPAVTSSSATSKAPSAPPVRAQKAICKSSDEIIADFHERRKIEFVSFQELGEKLNFHFTTAHAKYVKWCRTNGVDPIKYHSNGSSLDVLAPARLQRRHHDEKIAVFHAQRSAGPVHIKVLASTLQVAPTYAQELYSAWAKKNGVKRIDHARAT